MPDKRFEIVEKVEASAVDKEKSPQLEVARRLAPGQFLVKRQSFRIALPPVNVFEIPARLHQLFNFLALARRQTLGMERHLDRLPLRQPLGEIRDDIHVVFRCLPGVIHTGLGVVCLGLRRGTRGGHEQ